MYDICKIYRTWLFRALFTLIFYASHINLDLCVIPSNRKRFCLFSFCVLKWIISLFEHFEIEFSMYNAKKTQTKCYSPNFAKIRHIRRILILVQNNILISVIQRISVIRRISVIHWISADRYYPDAQNRKTDFAGYCFTLWTRDKGRIWDGIWDIERDIGYGIWGGMCDMERYMWYKAEIRIWDIGRELW